MLRFDFRLHLDDLSESEGLLDDAHTSVRLPIIGMTCQSCVNNIESTISSKVGIHKIRVILAENVGYIDYDPAMTDVRTIANAIDDMGFECPYVADENGAKSATDPGHARIRVIGMTCQSCVRNIEGKVGTTNGVSRISVSLADKEAQVDYDPAVISAELVAAIIDDMGFEASVSTGKETSSSTIQLKTDSPTQKSMNKCLILEISTF